MNPEEEKLLHALGTELRARKLDDTQQKLEALCSSELSTLEQTALAERAARDPELDRQFQAFAPLGQAEQAAISTGVLAALQARAASGVQATVAEEHDTHDAPRVIDLATHPRTSAKRFPRVAGILLPLCAAAAIGLFVTRTNAPSAEPLPMYELQVIAGASEMRGGTTPSKTSVSMNRDTRLRILLRPTTDAGPDVSARAYFVGPAIMRPWPVEITQASSGAMQLVLAPPPGMVHDGVEARIVIGRAALLAARGDDIARGDADRGEGFQRFHLALTPATQ